MGFMSGKMRFSENGMPDSLERLLVNCETLFYSGEKKPRNPVILTYTAADKMQKLREESDSIRENKGSFYEFFGLLLGQYDGNAVMLRDYIMPRSFEVLDSCEDLRERSSILIRKGNLDCVISRNHVSISEKFIERAYDDAYSRGMEIVGLDHTHPVSMIPSPGDIKTVTAFPNSDGKEVLVVQSGRSNARSAYMIKDSYVSKVDSVLSSCDKKDAFLILDMFPPMQEARDREEKKEILSRYLARH
jgi:proteasome lid subunit RPN8/RPN11